MREQQFNNLVLGFMKEFKVREGRPGEIPITSARDLYLRVWFGNNIEKKLKSMTPLKQAEIALRGGKSLGDVLIGADSVRSWEEPKEVFRKMAAAAIAARMWGILETEKKTKLTYYRVFKFGTGKSFPLAGIPLKYGCNGHEHVVFYERDGKPSYIYVRDCDSMCIGTTLDFFISQGFVGKTEEASLFD